MSNLIHLYTICIGAMFVCYCYEKSALPALVTGSSDTVSMYFEGIDYRPFIRSVARVCARCYYMTIEWLTRELRHFNATCEWESVDIMDQIQPILDKYSYLWNKEETIKTIPCPWSSDEIEFSTITFPQLDYRATCTISNTGVLLLKEGSSKTQDRIDDLRSLPVKRLRFLAQQAGIQKPYKLSKKQLIEGLMLV
mgnify:CR=1 FL=1